MYKTKNLKLDFKNVEIPKPSSFARHNVHIQSMQCSLAAQIKSNVAERDNTLFRRR